MEWNILFRGLQTFSTLGTVVMLVLPRRARPRCTMFHRKHWYFQKYMKCMQIKEWCALTWPNLGARLTLVLFILDTEGVFRLKQATEVQLGKTGSKTQYSQPALPTLIVCFSIKTPSMSKINNTNVIIAPKLVQVNAYHSFMCMHCIGFWKYHCFLWSKVHLGHALLGNANV